MKRIVAIVIAIVFVLGIVAIGFAAESKCGSCHKGDKALDKVVAKKNIKTTADLMKAVKEGPTAKMHAKFTDDDIKAEAKTLKLAE
ncbi:MAG TPA: hypothetical protein VEI96_00360 [Thermodesulfovibrionales bacterium]|nr:hypothetical protein [Thermodesulfovibrionales bacterium]